MLGETKKGQDCATNFIRCTGRDSQPETKIQNGHSDTYIDRRQRLMKGSCTNKWEGQQEKAYLKYVPQIDDEGIPPGLHPDPFSVLASHLKTSCLILHENSERPGVPMPAHSQSKIGDRTRWVVVETDSRSVVAEMLVKVLPWQTKAQREQAQKLET